MKSVGSREQPGRDEPSHRVAISSEELLAEIHRSGFRLRIVGDDLQLELLPSSLNLTMPPTLFREMMGRQAELYRLLSGGKVLQFPRMDSS